MSEFWDQISRWEFPFFSWIHFGWHSLELDVFFRTVTSLHQNLWVQVGFLIALLVMSLVIPWRRVFVWVLSLVLAVGFVDASLSYVVKQVMFRPRPHHLEWTGVEVRAGVHQPRQSGFPSNHAANSAAVAAATYTFFPIAAGAFSVLAVAVGLSRVYLGVHFPLDVLFGWFYGALCGLFISRILKRTLLTSCNSARHII